MKSLKIYNLPIECSVEIYDEAIKEYVNLVSKYPEVISIVQIGNVGVAGISDIDLIVYLDDSVICNNDYSLYQINKKCHQILMHDVFIIPYRLMNESFLITSIFDTKLVYGKELELTKISQELKIKESLILLNDICTVSLLFEYDRWHEIEDKDIKLIIARLNSIKYPIILLERISEFYNFHFEAKEIYRNFVQEFTEFRERWFANNKDNNIKSLLDFIQKARTIIAPQLVNDTISLNKKLIFFSYKNSIVSLKLGKEILLGDSTLFLNLIQYSKQDGLVSKHIKNAVNTNIVIEDVDVDYLSLLNKRILLINECFLFLNKNKIRYGELWTFGARQNISIFERIFNKLKRIIIK